MCAQEPNIEMFDHQRMQYIKLHLIGVVFFIILSVTRYFFRLDDMNKKPIGIGVLMGLVLSLMVITFSTVKSMIFWKSINQNAALKDALTNEYVQSLEVKSWKAAYLGAIGVTVFFAVSSFFYPVCDPVLIALTSIITGAGAYHATFYFKYRAY